VACTLPVAGFLKAIYPECLIDWVVDKRFAAIVEQCRFVDEVLVPESGGGLPGLRERTYEAALDMQGLFKSARYVALARAKRRVGYHWQREFSWLVSERILPDPTSHHIVDQYVDVARAIAPKPPLEWETDFGLVADELSLSAVDKKVGGVQGYVVINPGGAWVTKRLSSVQISTVVDELGKVDVRTVLIGGPSEDERRAAEAVAAGCKFPVLNLVGQTNLKELIALLSRARVHVGVDTGSTHLSAALGVPAVGLYSLTRPERSCPYGQIDRCLRDENGVAAIDPLVIVDRVRGALAESVVPE
jgi:ADP-heptose:LPS heptosyltransferase